MMQRAPPVPRNTMGVSLESLRSALAGRFALERQLGAVERLPPPYSGAVSSKPWEPDRLLTVDAARSAVRTRFPEIDVQGLEHIGSGWEFDAYLTSDGWVFRFPRRAHCAAFFEPEQRVHRLVAAALPPSIAIPHVQLIGEPTDSFPYRFAAHRHVAGVAADALASSSLPSLARDIAAAFGALHAIPEKTAREAGVGETASDDLGRKEWFERGLDLATQLHGLDPVVDEAVDWMRGLSLPLPRYEGPLQLIHGDLGPEHFIVDRWTGHLVGIIDWTDTNLGDAARDFVGLVPVFGWAFTESVLQQYPLEVDRGFRHRIRFVARLLSVMWLSEAHEQRADVAKHVGWVRNAFAAG